VLVEVLGPGEPAARGHVCIERLSGQFTTIPWARLSIDHLAPVAHRAGFTLENARRIERRWFTWLRSEPLA
jgi:hypothetical protein